MRWNGWAVFTCTRQVAQAIVADQQQHRDQYRQDLRDQGVPDNELDARVNETLAVLTFDGDTIVADQRGVAEDPEAIERIDPDPEGPVRGDGLELVLAGRREGGGIASAASIQRFLTRCTAQRRAA